MKRLKSKTDKIIKMIILVGVISIFSNVKTEAKVLRLDENSSVHFGGSYYKYEQNYHYDIFTGITIKKSKDNRTFKQFDYLEEVFCRPVIVGKTLYFLKDNYSYSGKKPWKLLLYSYDLKTKKKKLLKILSNSENKRYGEAFLKKGNVLYIQTFDEDGDGLIIYELNLKTKKKKIVCKNYYAISVFRNCKDNYKNYLLCQNRTTGTGGFGLYILNLKTKKVRCICKEVASLYLQGKCVYYIDKKGIWSEDESYMEGFKTAKIKKYDFKKKRSKTVKKIRVCASTHFVNMTKNKVYFKEVCKGNKVRNRKVSYK